MKKLLLSLLLCLSFTAPGYADITSNIELCLNFENANKGIDDSDNGYDMTETGSITQETGKIGSYAVSFATTADYLKLLNASGPNLDMGTGSMSISFWTTVGDVTTTQQVYDQRAGTGNGYQVVIQTTGKVKIDRDGGALETSENTTNIESLGWTHVLIVYDSVTEDVLFYINGALDKTDTATTSLNVTSTSDTYVGNNETGTLTFVYPLEQVIVYSDGKVLADAQALYNSGSGTDPCNPSTYTPKIIIAWLKRLFFPVEPPKLAFL